MCNVCMPISDEANTTDEFADQLLDMLNQGALSLMVSIGHRTGLFDSLAELASPGCEQLAAHAGLDATLCEGMAGRHGHRGHCEIPARHAMSTCYREAMPPY